MTKTETKKLLSKIKGYYNNQFFVDDYVVDAWEETMKPYDLEDAIEHIEIYLKENPDIPPKPHTFKKGLYTHEEKEMIRNSKYIVQCNLCHRWMPLAEYDSHYDKCLSIDYLVVKSKEYGKGVSREDLENCRQDVLSKLYEKYKPETAEYIPEKI